MLQKLEACPLCSHPESDPFIQVKDFAISGESFALERCSNCSLIYTNPRPSEQNLSGYYDSDNYISHSRNSKSLRDTLYYLTRQYMLWRKLNWISKLAGKKKKLLDYGCGTGSFVSYIYKNKWDAWGFEPNDLARSKVDSQVKGRIFGKLEAIPTNQFEVITLWHVLEHVPNLNTVIENLLSHLTETGLLLIAVPNCASYDAQYYKEHWAGYDVPRHLSHFTFHSMKLLAKRHRLQIETLIPLKLDAFYVSLLSEQYRNGSTFNSFYQAIKSNIRAKRNKLNYSSMVYVLRK